MKNFLFVFPSQVALTKQNITHQFRSSRILGRKKRSPQTIQKLLDHPKTFRLSGGLLPFPLHKKTFCLLFSLPTLKASSARKRSYSLNTSGKPSYDSCVHCLPTMNLISVGHASGIRSQNATH